MKNENEEPNEWRCSCGKLLFRGTLVGVIELKCSRCHKMNYLKNYEPLTASKKNLTVLVSFKGKIIEVSDSIEDVIGVAPSQLTGKNMSALVGKSLYAAARFSLAKMKQTQKNDSQVYTSIAKVKNKDGKLVDISYTVRTVPHEGGWAALYNMELGHNAGIEHKKRLQKQPDYQQPNQRLWDFEVDHSGIIQATSLFNRLGYKDGEVNGKSIFEVLDDQVNFNKKEKAPLIRRGEDIITTVTVSRIDGTKHTYSIMLKDSLSLTEGNDNYFVFLMDPVEEVL